MRIGWAGSAFLEASGPDGRWTQKSRGSSPVPPAFLKREKSCNPLLRTALVLYISLAYSRDNFFVFRSACALVSFRTCPERMNSSRVSARMCAQSEP